MYYLNTSQSLTNSTWNIVKFDTTVSSNSNLSYSSSTGVFTAKASGLYMFTAFGVPTSTPASFISFQYNGNSVINNQLPFSASGTTSYNKYMNVNDTMSVRIYQSNSQSAEGAASNSTTYCQVQIGIINF